MITEATMSEREWVQCPQDIPVETKFGTVFLTVTDGKHIYANASGHDKFLTYRDNKYSTSLHLEPSTEPGSRLRSCWIPMRDEKDRDHEARTAFYCKKFQSFARHDDAAPKTYAVAIKAEIERAVNEWAAKNPRIILEAERAAASNELRDEEKAVEEIRKTLAEAQSARMAAETRFRIAEYALNGDGSQS